LPYAGQAEESLQVGGPEVQAHEQKSVANGPLAGKAFGDQGSLEQKMQMPDCLLRLHFCFSADPCTGSAEGAVCNTLAGSLSKSCYESASCNSVASQ
jgi:hypothetical protein